ncbi:MAG: DUF4743 domain-containing protein [Betaproteobacteria bacterium]
MIEPRLDHVIAARLNRLLQRSADTFLPLHIDGRVVGWVTPPRARRLARWSDVFDVDAGAIAFAAPLVTSDARTMALDRVTRTLADEGALSPWRDERYAIAPTFGAAPWFDIERAAARYFGVHSWAVHGNGLVDCDGAIHMWLARRSATKAIDPGMLDNLVGGGVPAGFDLRHTFIKEAWEEAGLSSATAHAAPHVSTLHIARETGDGLMRESIAIYDLVLPRDREPVNQDGEAVDHRRMTLGDAARLIALDAGPDQVTPEASVIILDALERLGYVDPRGPAAATLATLRVMA